jgi:hypothetical protein
MDEIIDNIYKEMYLSCDTPVDYLHIKEGRLSYEYFYLAQSEQEKIIQKHLSKKRLTKLQKIAISNTINLGYSPNTKKFEIL